MKTMRSAFCALLALSFVGSASLPAAAVPMAMPKAPEASSGVVDVQMRRDRRDRRDRFERRGNRNYYNGHRGYRERRQGYREYRGYWFPPAAFITGAIIGGALSQGATRGNAHVSWCANRYRSYRASDNTFQPYNGPRQRCVSPYR